MGLLSALPTISTAGLPLDECVSSNRLLEGPVAQIVQWKCHCDGDALRAERRHSTWVLSIVAAGACCVHDAGWRATLDPVNALLHRPGSTYRTTHPYGFIDSGWNIAYDKRIGDEILGDLASLAGWDRPAMTVATRPARLALAQMTAIQRYQQGLNGETVELEELAIELLQAVVVRLASRRSGARAGTRTEHHKTVECAREFLNEHYTSPLDLKKIAKAAGASPSHLCRLFKRYAGVPMRVYLHRLRIGAALEAAAVHGLPLSQAALQAGFSSQAHMTSVCTRLFGSPPGVLRAQVVQSWSLHS